MTGLNQDIKRLKGIIATTKDDFAKSQYQATLDGKEQQVKNFTDTGRHALDRWHAQLDNALSTLDTILSQVLRIRSSEVLSLSSATDQVSQSLKERSRPSRPHIGLHLDTVYGLSDSKAAL